jgi:hypothetical protein
MMLSLTSPTRTAVFLARIVILLALEIGRVHDALVDVLVLAEEPACQRSASTSVVLP